MAVISRNIKLFLLLNLIQSNIVSVESLFAELHPFGPETNPGCTNDQLPNKYNVKSHSYAVSLHLPNVKPLPMSGSFKRTKRDWIIPPLNFPENEPGPYPKPLVKLKSSIDKEVTIIYIISGPGADEHPTGVFTVDQHSGVIYVTQTLDREKRASYSVLCCSYGSMPRAGGIKKEKPMMIVINVIDRNDNAPKFTSKVFHGEVNEKAGVDEEIIRVTAIDKDDPKTSNAILRYEIRSQVPQHPIRDMFAINTVSGMISLKSSGLDRETHQEYQLMVEAADMEGEGLIGTCTVIIIVADSNDNAPQFIETSVSVLVPEEKAGVEVARLKVTDKDELGTPNAVTKYSLIQGNEGREFKISTGSNNMEGIISTIKSLDFESTPVLILLVVVTNEAAFTDSVSTSTATVTVMVLDENEAPVFSPAQVRLSILEGVKVGASLAELNAWDPDTSRRQKIRYKLYNDTAGWLRIGNTTGSLYVGSSMDRESHYVKNGTYTILVMAYDDDPVPATGTSTLILTVTDVNDHPPVVRQKKASFCSKDPVPAILDILDQDGVGHARPFTVELLGAHRLNWSTHINSSSDVLTLVPKRDLNPGDYNVSMRIYDAGMLSNQSTLHVEVCHCQGAVVTCFIPRFAAQKHHSSVTNLVLGTVFGVTSMLLFVLLVLRKRKNTEKKAGFLEDLPRDKILDYSDQGGGEDDKDFDLSQLYLGMQHHSKLTSHGFGHIIQASQDEQQSQSRAIDEIGKLIKANLLGADSDPTTPPFDSLLEFNDEGGLSESLSLSSFKLSDSEEEQDFQSLSEWGPRFSQLIELYWGDTQQDDDTKTLPGKTEWV